MTALHDTAIAASAPRKGITTLSWRVRGALGVLCLIAVGTVWVTNTTLTAQFTQSTRQAAQLRLALYSGNIVSEVQRTSIVPRLLASDPELIGALQSSEFTLTSQRLISFVDEIGAAAITLMDNQGRVVATTDRRRLGTLYRQEPFFVNAVRSDATVFTTTRSEANIFAFSYARAIAAGGQTLGVVMVEANLQKFQTAWAGISDAVAVRDSQGTIVLATEASWIGVTEAEALARRSAPSAIERALRATADWTAVSADAYLSGRAVIRQEARIPFQGWQMSLYTSYGGVRQRVNAVLALEIMGFAILFSLAFYQLTRKTLTRALLFQKESEGLRMLNAQLQKEISERQRAEKNLEVAEQTIAQSSKLAVLGEMSAAVSHELNQPLAAMKTYLAAAKLLLARKRPEEALSSFQRIDDLIGRMGGITRQLKSYTRQGGDDFVPLDMRTALAGAIEIMEPQLKERRVALNTTQPSEAVMILGDQLRLEQVIVNLLRNALDATLAEDVPSIEIRLTSGNPAALTVRDNGSGIENLDDLFEPFFTTKRPGDGIGLGLAISSGIVTDMGGRLTARNADMGGAVFEVYLPTLKSDP